MAPSSSIISMLKRQTSTNSNSNNCYFDEFGNEQCGGLGYGTRIGIGVAIAAGIVVLFFFLSLMRRRRNNRISNFNSTLNTTTQTQPYQSENQYGGPIGRQSVYNGAAHSYYPPTPQQKNTYYGPPAGPPPELEDPFYPVDTPSMPPPSYQHKEGKV